MEKLLNFRRLSGTLGTAGQPQPEQFSAIRAAGYEVVINLAMPDSPRALPDEEERIQALGMEYIHIPVVWESPTPEDVERFFAAMDRYRGRKVFVHCALNMRVSCFAFLYRVLRLGVAVEKAWQDVLAVWEPNERWRNFVDEVLNNHKNTRLIQGETPMAYQEQFESDCIPTSAGDLHIIFLGHGSLMFAFQGKTFHVDPFSKVADYAELPQADVILITHEHRDHLDQDALAHVRTEETVVILNPSGAQQVEGGVVMHNGDERTVAGVHVAAVPAYNIVHKRDSGQPYHPQGEGNGYVLTFGDKKVYVAGDTENVPEMKALQGIDYAFLPMNLPYTMTPEMVADAAKAFRPGVLYPYHYGSTDTEKLEELLKGEGIEVRIRDMA